MNIIADFLRSVKIFVFVTLVLVLQACNQKGKLVTQEPSMAEVAGKYDLSYWNFNDALDAEIQEKGAGAYIVLREDGSLSFHQIPVVSESDNGAYFLQRIHSGEGSYSISAMGATAKSEFYGLYIERSDLPNPLNAPRLRKKGDFLTLSVEYFDGDFVERMRFTRKVQAEAK